MKIEWEIKNAEDFEDFLKRVDSNIPVEYVCSLKCHLCGGSMITSLSPNYFVKNHEHDGEISIRIKVMSVY